VYREDYPKPSPAPNDVLVKVHYCGICGSDITNFKLKLYQVPLIMGHEFTGEVVEMGSNVTSVNLGDKVCGINVLLDVSQGELDGLGIFKDGGFAEYVKVPEKYLFHIPDTISTKEAVMIESFANIVRAIKLSNIGDNQNIIIIGGGNIGLCFLNFLLSEKHPNFIVVIEPHEYLRGKAKDMGATEALPPSMVKIKKFIKTYGEPSFIFDCVGNEDSLLMAIELIKRGGTILLEGVHKGSVSLPVFLINSKEICLKGSLSHDREDILFAINLIAQGKIHPSNFISKVVPLNEIQKTFEEFLEPGEREFVKAIVKM
jgi:2-desacetyl-2-hydroxyethyl bacteriochlorophyllide A dehydrogenase